MTEPTAEEFEKKLQNALKDKDTHIELTESTYSPFNLRRMFFKDSLMLSIGTPTAEYTPDAPFWQFKGNCAVFNLDYLYRVVSILKKAEVRTVKLYLKKDWPLACKAKIFNGQELKFWLAPIAEESNTFSLSIEDIVLDPDEDSVWGWDKQECCVIPVPKCEVGL